MKPINLIAASLVALSLSACSKAQDAGPAETAAAEATMDMPGDAMAMGKPNPDMSGRIGRATGTIKSLGGQGDFLTIDHGPIEGVGMGAMTMGFDIAGGIDLSGFAEGDTVAFTVKQSRDGAYRVMSICNTGAEGADCLDKPIDQ